MNNQCKISFSEILRNLFIHGLNGKNYIKGNRIIRMNGLRLDVSYEMPQDVDVVCDGAFTKCVNLGRIELSENLKEIGSGAFLECISLEVIQLPSSLKYIGSNAFGNGLKSVIFSSLDLQIEQDAFKNCQKLQIVVPNGEIERFKRFNLNLTKDVKIIDWSFFLRSIPDSEIFFEEKQNDDGTKFLGYQISRGIKILNCNYRNANRFQDGLAAVSENGNLYGYINVEGKYVIAPIFEIAENFYGGVARVKYEGKYKWINNKGEFIDTPTVSPPDSKDNCSNFLMETYKKYDFFISTQNLFDEFFNNHNEHISIKKSKEGWLRTCKEIKDFKDFTIKLALHKLGDGFDTIDTLLEREVTYHGHMSRYIKDSIWIIRKVNGEFYVFSSLKDLIDKKPHINEIDSIFYTEEWNDKDPQLENWIENQQSLIDEFVKDNEEILNKVDNLPCDLREVATWYDSLYEYEDQMIGKRKIFTYLDCQDEKTNDETKLEFIYNGEIIFSTSFRYSIKRFCKEELDVIIAENG